MRGRTKILSRDESGNLSAHIETENLIIRSIREDDLGHLNSLMTDERVMQFVGAGGARDEARIARTHQTLVDYWKDGNPISGFMVFKKHGGDFAGMACLEEVWESDAPKAGEAEVMLYFRPEFWGQGYGKELGKTFLGSLVGMFKEGEPMRIAGQPITKLVATAHPENSGSIKLQESLGFTRVADMQKAFRTASGALEMRPRAFFELDLQKLVEAPRSGVASDNEAVKVGEVSTRGRKGSKKSGETMNL